MARPHAALVLRWPQSREACASEARRGDARALHTVAEARRADARARHYTVAEARRGDTTPRAARHTVSEARCSDARPHHTVAEARRSVARAHTVVEARYAGARARHTVAVTHRAVHLSCCARPSPQSATGAGKPASRSVSRTGAAHPTAAACRCGRGHRRFWSLLPISRCRRPRGRGRRAGRGLASDPWRPVV
eukprot:scaffold13640_cov64-Phaeocystis_antarctica.AAC.1